MTQRYAHLRYEALKRGADIAGDIIGNALASIEEEKKLVNI